jgi:hypothetical protein
VNEPPVAFIVPPAPPALPRRTRNLAVVAAVLAASVGMFSAAGVLELAELGEARGAMEDQVRRIGIHNPDEVLRLHGVAIAALEGMRGWRTFILTVLSISSALVFVSAARMLRLDAVPREALRRMLAGGAVVAAIFRTLDGAQSMALAKRVGEAARHSAPTLLPPNAPTGSVEVLQTLFGLWLPAGAAVFTALIAGAFLLVSQHFRSAPVREALARIDQHRAR